MSYRNMTKPERKRHVRRKFFGIKEKVFVLASFLVIVLVLIVSFAASLQQNYDPILPVLIFAGIVLAVMAGIFFVDLIWWDTE